MFMLMKTDDVFSKQLIAPKFKLKGKQPLRTRDGWAVQMYQHAVAAGSRYFAFRHGGRWWLYDTRGPERGAPVKDFPTQEATEMWLHHRG
jgi:hypothetical protein